MHPSGHIRPRCESESTWAHDGNAPNPPFLCPAPPSEPLRIDFSTHGNGKWCKIHAVWPEGNPSQYARPNSDNAGERAITANRQRAAPVAKDCLAGSSRLLTSYGRRYLANDNGRRARKPTALFSGQKQNDVTASQSPKLSPIVLASFLVKPSWVILRRWNRSSKGRYPFFLPPT